MIEETEPQPQDDDEIPDIVGDAPPVDEYRLSTRPGTVGGGSYHGRIRCRH
ncbi:hypothetical protein [Streptomyces sp. NPDC057115]|uniref:hypothetical protein n=1 Tax=Streptomyces sp. NPDC057115 TaxID=3346022 RepID=UPI003642A9ED